MPSHEDINQGSQTMNRRQFIHSTVAGGLCFSHSLSNAAQTSNSKINMDPIESFEFFPVRYPMTGYFKFFTGPHGKQGRAAVVVKIKTRSGKMGWGQSVPIAKWSYETLETAHIVLKNYFGPALIGHDPTDIEGAHALMDAVIAPGFSTGMPITRAGIDLALHDVKGRILNQSLARMFGRPTGKPLTLSWTVNVRSMDEVDKVMEEGKARGYHHFNIKVAPDPDFDVELAKSVRKLAPESFLWADANGGYTPETALIAAPRLADAGVDVLEAPVRPNRIQAYRDLKKQGALPIYMDEGVVSPQDLREFIRLDMLDGVAMKPSRCGGLESARRQIEMLEHHGLKWLGSGLTDPDISMSATVALYASYGLEHPAALNGPQFLTRNILNNPLQISEGQISLPEGPGLGVEVDEDHLRYLAKA